MTGTGSECSRVQGQANGKPASAEERAASEAAVSAAGGKGMKAALEGLGALHDEGQYREEFELKGFLGSLR